MGKSYGALAAAKDDTKANLDVQLLRARTMSGWGFGVVARERAKIKSCPIALVSSQDTFYMMEKSYGALAAAKDDTKANLDFQARMAYPEPTA
eukprot:4455683-Prymnesium_polylepis.1